MPRDNVGVNARKRASKEDNKRLRALLKSGYVIIINLSNWPRVVRDRIVIKAAGSLRPNCN